MKTLILLAILVPTFANAGPHLDAPSVTCTADTLGTTEIEADPVVITESEEDGSLDITFTKYLDLTTPYHVIYSNAQLLAATNAHNTMLEIRRQPQGRFEMRIASQNPDGSLGTKSFGYALDCGGHLRID
jgi:hypothetical protein